MLGHEYIGFHRICASHRRVEIVNLEPEKHPISIGLVSRIADFPMVMLDVKVM